MFFYMAKAIFRNAEPTKVLPNYVSVCFCNNWMTFTWANIYIYITYSIKFSFMTNKILFSQILV